MNLADNIECRYTHKQEVRHSLIHAFGVLYGVINLPTLLQAVSENGSAADRMAASVYAFCFIATFFASALFHTTIHAGRKRFFKMADYVCIYFFVAATYTPLLAHYPNDEGQYRFLPLIWSGAFFCAILKLLLADRYQLLLVSLYFLVALLPLACADDLLSCMPQEAQKLFVAGMFFFGMGFLFYVCRKWQHHHTAWHLFSLAGAMCQFKAMILLNS